jgi:hypothetical protein
MIFQFRDHVYEAPYAPYYEKYKGHIFRIDHFYPEDKKGHVWLTCVDDPSVTIDGYVHMVDLEYIQQQ